MFILQATKLPHARQFHAFRLLHNMLWYLLFTSMPAAAQAIL